LKRYFAGVRSLAIVSNIPLSFVPRAFTDTMMATPMPAAISAYSMAVAPDSSLTRD
jgi:hypothetical protein